MAPFFSICVTTYNRLVLLIETINSILKQTFTDYEVLILNDNPERQLTLASLGVFDNRIKIINQPVNLGEVANQNFFLQKSSGRYITWIADDDLYRREYLEAAYKAIVKYAFPHCVFTSFDIFKGEPPFFKADNHACADVLLSGDEFLWRYCRGRIKTITLQGIFEEKTIKSIGGIEDVSGGSIGLFAEYMLLLRSGMLEKLVYINRPLVLFRDHVSSWGGTNIDMEIYRRGADNLTNRSIELLKDPRFKDHFYSYLYFVLKLAVFNNLVVMSRRKHLGDRSLKNVLAYLIYTRKYISSLRGTKPYMLGLLVLIRAQISAVFFLIRCKIINKSKK